MIEAGWELYDHFHSLGESVKDSQNKAGLGSYGIANMTAVLDQKQKFKALTKTYVDQAAEYVGVELLNKTTSQLQLSLAQHEARKEPHLPDLFQLHQDVDDLTSLVHVRHLHLSALHIYLDFTFHYVYFHSDPSPANSPINFKTLPR